MALVDKLDETLKSVDLICRLVEAQDDLIRMLSYSTNHQSRIGAEIEASRDKINFYRTEIRTL